MTALNGIYGVTVAIFGLKGQAVLYVRRRIRDFSMAKAAGKGPEKGEKGKAGRVLEKGEKGKAGKGLEKGMDDKAGKGPEKGKEGKAGKGPEKGEGQAPETPRVAVPAACTPLGFESSLASPTTPIAPVIAMSDQPFPINDFPIRTDLEVGIEGGGVCQGCNRRLECIMC